MGSTLSCLRPSSVQQGQDGASFQVLGFSEIPGERDGLLLRESARAGMPPGFDDVSDLLERVPSAFRPRAGFLAARPGSDGLRAVVGALADFAPRGLTEVLIRDMMIRGAHLELLPSLGVLLRHGLVSFAGLSETVEQSRWNLLPHKHCTILHCMSASDPRLAHDPEHSSLPERFAVLARSGVCLDLLADNAETPLMWAVRTGNEATAMALVDAGADVTKANRHGMTALHIAAGIGNASMVPILARDPHDAGLPIAKGKREGWTALHLAAAEGGVGHCEVIGMLGVCGAGVNDRNPQGDSALMVATTRGHGAAVRALVDAGACVDLKHGAQNSTALHHACAQGMRDVGVALLESGANPDAMAADGSRPLHLVGRRLPGMPGHRVDLAKALVAGGANIDQPDRHGLLPLEAAGRQGNDFVYNYLDGLDAAGERKLCVPAIYP